VLRARERMGGRAGAHPSQGEHRVSRIRLYSRGTSSTSSMGGLAAGALLSGSPPGRAGALPPGPLKLRLDLDQCPLRPQGAESPADIEHRELPCNWSVPQAVCLPSRQRCGRVPMLSTRVFVTIPTPVTSPV